MPTFLKNKTILLPYLALALGVSALSLSAMFVRWANAPGPVTGFYRLLFSTILLTPIFIREQRKHTGFPWTLILFPALGGLFTAFDFTFWNSSLKYTTAANATLLGNTSPLWVALGTWLIFRQKLAPRFWVGLALALTGAVLIMGMDFIIHPTFGLGDLMACAAGVFYASYQMITQRGRQHFDPLRYSWIVAFSATLVIFFVNLALGNPLTGYSSQTWLIFLLTAIVSQTIGYLSITYSLGHLPAHVVSPTLIAQPVLTALLAIPLLSEIPTLWQGLGGLVALAGIYIVNQSHVQVREELPNA
jgi:drug/metabolite transporter (DMT)-like permease